MEELISKFQGLNIRTPPEPMNVNANIISKKRKQLTRNKNTSERPLKIQVPDGATVSQRGNKLMIAFSEDFVKQLKSQAKMTERERVEFSSKPEIEYIPRSYRAKTTLKPSARGTRGNVLIEYADLSVHTHPGSTAPNRTDYWYVTLPSSTDFNLYTSDVGMYKQGRIHFIVDPLGYFIIIVKGRNVKIDKLLNIFQKYYTEVDNYVYYKFPKNKYPTKQALKKHINDLLSKEDQLNISFHLYSDIAPTVTTEIASNGV